MLADQSDGNGLKAFETLGAFFRTSGWQSRRIGSNHTYQVILEGKNGKLVCYALVLEDAQRFTFYITIPQRVSEARRSEVAEYITRANYGLQVGNFEMDYADGEVRYKSCVDFEGDTLTFMLIRNAIFPAVQTMDQYLLGLMEVISGKQTPVEAISRAKQS